MKKKALNNTQKAFGKRFSERFSLNPNNPNYVPALLLHEINTICVQNGYRITEIKMIKNDTP
jgi:hypothetical protein